MSEDPAQDGLNWYVYCANNPVMFVDPSGLNLILQRSGDEVQFIWQAILQISSVFLINGDFISISQIYLLKAINYFDTKKCRE